MESEQFENFNERLSQWVSNQGFWFQVRYSMAGSGVSGRAMFHLLRMAARVMIFFLMIAVGFWIYLMKRPGTESFAKGLRDNLESGLSATELEIRGIQQLQGRLKIARFAAHGGTETFFDALEARNIQLKMSLLDDLIGTWQLGNVAISRLELDLRAGTNDAESATKLAETIFRKSAKFEAASFNVADATLRWGYSERTQGAIQSSHLKMQRAGDSWRLHFSGGTFSQNWLHQLDIIDLVVIVENNGLTFEKAELKNGTATIKFPGLKVASGERPEVSGIVKIHKLPLDRVLPPTSHNFIEGNISGEFKVFGSTNSSDGIGFDGQVVMDGTNLISLRERIHLLKALSVVDYSRNYHRVDFREGSFSIKTQRGGMQVSEINLKADDLFTLEGAFAVRLPTPKEIEAAMAKGSEMSPIFAQEEESTDLFKPNSTKPDFTLRRAAQETQRTKESSSSPESISLFDRIDQSIEMRKIQNQAAEHISHMLQYEGALRITIPEDAFERAPRLKAAYPTDPSISRVALKVPLLGPLHELTLRQAEDIYQQGRR